MEALKKRAESMSECEKLCVLTFDGMALKAKLQYLVSHDKIFGFVDLADFSSESKEVAKQAVQFMIRGLSTKWKFPLGHFFGPVSVKADTLKLMVDSAISALESIGLFVVALVCDQEI